MNSAAPSDSNESFAYQRVSELTRICQQERKAYRTESEQASPACVELFRRAFADDHEAWESVMVLIQPLMRSWAQRKASWQHTYGYDGLDDVVQQGLMYFLRSGRKRHDLLAGDQLGPILGYLRKCVVSAIMKGYRKKQAPQSPGTVGDLAQPTNVALDQVAEVASSVQVDVDVEHMLRQKQLIEYIDRHLDTPQERLLFQLFFLRDTPPRDITARYPEHFASVLEVNKVTQRLTRRFRKDEDIKALRADFIHTHAMDTAPSEHTASEQTHCQLDEEILFAYALGTATTVERALVEQAPACLTAAQQLENELASYQQLLYRITCPSPEQLIAYHERTLIGTEQLVVHRHVGSCPTCQEEQALLASIYDVALLPEVRSVRRIIEALFQSPLGLPQPVRGGGLYKTPQIQIDISTPRASGGPRTWMVLGEVRTSDGAPLDTSLEAVLLDPLDTTEGEELHGQVDDGLFEFDHVAAGTYRLRILMPEEEVFIRQIVVGDALRS